VVLAHNGIIENYAKLKEELIKAGREFTSATDTEVAAHLIDQALQKGAANLHAAVREALGRIEGSYALVVMDVEDDSQIVVARNASPMVLGRANGAAFAASDIPAVLEHTRDFVFLEDGDTAVLKRDKTEFFDRAGNPVARVTKHINWDPISAEKQGYKHFMLKEIFEQPSRIIDTLRGRIDVDRADVDLGEITLDQTWLQNIQKLTFIACGTSFYAALVGKYMIESIARVPVEVDLASEFRYRDPLITENTLCVAVSQSGETADTLAAMKLARSLGAKALTICNVLKSAWRAPKRSQHSSPRWDCWRSGLDVDAAFSTTSRPPNTSMHCAAFLPQ
jgi:glucosamine--fructose-6-phosphate aminotransferase (isomerizing)